MKIAGPAVYVLHDAITQGIKQAVPGFSQEQAWVYAKTVVDALTNHPTLKVTQVGVRQKQGGANV